MNDWIPSEGIVYTDELRDIITAEGSVAVLAGAGSGKTELLAQKASFLFSTGKCSWPNRILSLTFKREAQYNIKKRVDQRCGTYSTRFDSFTFHAFAKSIVDRFRCLLDEDIRPKDNYDIVSKDAESDGITKLVMRQIIELSINILLKNKDIMKILTDSYKYVFIDEFQDTTDAQYSLIKCIFDGSDTKFLCVGDINQSIMLWAGARTTVFNDYIEDFSASYKLLVTNYRSSEDIQRVLTIFLEYMKNQDTLSVNSTVSSGGGIKIFRDEAQEANYIANRIKNMIESGIEESEICILTKQQSSIYTQVIRDSLNNLGINNLDMSDLQDSLKEPLGEIFSLYAKFLTCPEPKNTCKLHDLYLYINNIERDDTQEERVSSEFYHFVQAQKRNIDDTVTVDFLLLKINEFITFIGFDKIKAKWKQYKSQAFTNNLWVILELHLRNVFLKTASAIDAVKLFTADNAVQIMNIHKCKGLEYKSVFFIGLEDQAFWNYSNAKFENDCAIYVAMSRAKENLEITYTCHREHRRTQYYDNRASSCDKVKSVYHTLISNCLLPLDDLTK
ncbi:UvrD-helicase domain-containing protein [Photobacterium phosphoreum]|uniref:UvrD-helicase domain-containing protein n=2 Tax=Photobacterium phosphoreum TaxID=659 RepID=UPI001E4BF877|nr:ATP-dependent helicase [Photobacterium phosphoreum]